MPGFPDHVVDAAWGPDALAATHRGAAEQPRWLAGLIARYGPPTVTIDHRAGSSTEYAWPDRGVRIGEEMNVGHYVAASRDGCGYVERGGLDRHPTDAEISGVVALAGLDDAPDGLAS